MIWIIGNQGMLGQELAEQLTLRNTVFVGTDREVSILDLNALRTFAQDVEKRSQITEIVNCAAYTAVDRAEDEPEFAQALNVQGPANIALIARDLNARFIHISTDYVFSGTASRPYREDDAVGPTGVYGATKAEGEKRVLTEYPEAIIIRTAWLYGKYGPNFVATMLRLMRERTELGVVADQHGTPTWARDLAQAIITVLTADTWKPGVYHYTNEGETTWYEFTCEIYAQGKVLGLLPHEVKIRPLKTSEYPTRAKRPAYSVLSKEKIVRTFGLVIPSWKNSLYQYLKEEAFQ
jgi:dTDP-4-dehydrorhamnose reductase